MSLSLLLHPYDKESFFREVWERRVHHVTRDDPAYFSFLRDDLGLEEIIWKTCHTWGEVSLARANTDYRDAPHAVRPPSVSTVKKAFLDNYTIIVNNLEKKNVRVAQLCRDVEKDWCFNSNVNLYATRKKHPGAKLSLR